MNLNELTSLVEELVLRIQILEKRVAALSAAGAQEA